MNDTIQLKLQVDMFTTNTKVQLLALAKDLYLAKPEEFDSFLQAYYLLAEQVFGPAPQEEPQPKQPSKPQV